MSTPALPAAQRPALWAQPIKPELNLYQVDRHLYRSRQPDLPDLATLEHLHITTVINLRQRQTDSSVFAHSPIRLINIPMQTWAIHDKQLVQALQHINLGTVRGNVLVHCQHGADRTGVVIATYRIINQHWPIEAARAEMKYGGFGFHPIWINIDRLLQPAHIKHIQQLMAATPDMAISSPAAVPSL